MTTKQYKISINTRTGRHFVEEGDSGYESPQEAWKVADELNLKNRQEIKRLARRQEQIDRKRAYQESKCPPQDRSGALPRTRSRS